MGFYDRHYNREQQSSPFGYSMRHLFPSVTPVVRWLLIANIVIFIPGFLIQTLSRFLYEWFSVLPISSFHMIQLWRPITYQFLHGGIFHVFFNMLVLFFFGPMLEQMWGSRRFAFFYLACGAAGGILYIILVLFRILEPGVMVGASGAIYGMLAAGAILFPNLRVFVMGIFPIPLSVLAILLVVFSVLNFLGGQNAGGEAAHLAGMAVGAAYVVWRPWMDKIRFKSAKTQWEKNLEKERQFRVDVDRILDKVHANGIQSLTWREKRILKKATQREQESRKS